MGITRSFNKHNGVYYAYETVYEWSEEKQKKVQRKRCIGQFVPGTDEIIPNGPRGKKPLIESPVFRHESAGTEMPSDDKEALQILAGIRSKLTIFEQLLTELSEVTRDILNSLPSESDKQA